MFPSEISPVKYAAFRDYNPARDSEEAQRRWDHVIDLKNDKIRNKVSIIDRFVEEIAKKQFEFREFFGHNRGLIPIPRSSPLKPQSLWPSKRITEEMQKHGLGVSLPIISRQHAVQKSSTAARGKRPSPSAHYSSYAIQMIRCEVEGITIIDDVITRGSTVLGAIPHIASHYPDIDIKVFAIFVTKRDEETTYRHHFGTIQCTHDRPTRT